MAVVPDACPVRNSDVTFRRVGSEYLLVHGLLKQYHVLNSIAGRIWDLLTGQNSVREIAAIIAAEHGEEVIRVERDVTETLEGLQALQLVSIPASR